MNKLTTKDLVTLDNQTITKTTNLKNILRVDREGYGVWYKQCTRGSFPDAGNQETALHYLNHETDTHEGVSNMIRNTKPLMDKLYTGSNENYTVTLSSDEARRLVQFFLEVSQHHFNI